MIYQGGWPYYFEKSELSGGDVFGVGERFMELKLRDQFGDRVSLWDFYNQDTYVMLEFCATWASPCVSMSQWIAGDSNVAFDAWNDVRDAVAEGDLVWMTVLTPHGALELTQEEVEEWAEDHPNERVPVLADIESVSEDFARFAFVPTLVLLSPDLTAHTLTDVASVDYSVVLDAAMEILE